MTKVRFIEIFRPVNARRLLITRVLGQGGDGLLQTALATFVLFSPARQADPMRITMVFALLLMPYSLIGPFVGVFIDKWSRRKILIRANLIRVAAMVLIALSVAGHSANGVLAVLVLVCLGVNRFALSTLSASLPHVVERNLLVAGNAIFPTMGTGGASLAAATGLGLQHLFGNTDAVNASLILLAGGLTLGASSIASKISPSNILGPDQDNHEVRDEFRNLFVGFVRGGKIIISTPRVLLSVGSVTILRCAFGGITMQTLLLSRQVWNSQSATSAALRDFGIIAALAAVGSFCGAFTTGALLQKQKEVLSDSAQNQRIILLRITLGVSVSAGIFCSAGFYFGTHIWIYLAAFNIGLLSQLVKVNADTAIQQEVDDLHRGRVFAIFDMLINFAVVFGVAIFGVLGSAPTQSVLSTFVIGALLGATAWLIFKILRLTPKAD